MLGVTVQSFLSAASVMVASLTYLPALALGPIVEHLAASVRH